MIAHLLENTVGSVLILPFSIVQYRTLYYTHTEHAGDALYALCTISVNFTNVKI
jgi:hypothetical protein